MNVLLEYVDLQLVKHYSYAWCFQLPIMLKSMLA